MTDNDLETDTHIIVEFSKEIAISALPATGREYALEANEAALKAIAKRFKIPAVNSLTATLLVTPIKEGMDFKGHIKANLTRECVASLELMEEEIDDRVEIIFDRHVVDELPDFADMDALEDFSKDKREPLKGDNIDIGEIVVQHLSLIMEPYPRREGVPSLADQYGQSQEGSPFDVLKDIVADRKPS